VKSSLDYGLIIISQMVELKFKYKLFDVSIIVL
jgi:hypothetical protein